MTSSSSLPPPARARRPRTMPSKRRMRASRVVVTQLKGEHAELQLELARTATSTAENAACALRCVWEWAANARLSQRRRRLVSRVAARTAAARLRLWRRQTGLLRLMVRAVRHWKAGALLEPAGILGAPPQAMMRTRALCAKAINHWLGSSIVWSLTEWHANAFDRSAYQALMQLACRLWLIHAVPKGWRTWVAHVGERNLVRYSTSQWVHHELARAFARGWRPLRSVLV